MDLAADARIRPVDEGPLGPILSLEELAADKVLALFDRAQAGRLCDLAREKDSGFSALVLLEMLGSFRRFAPGDFSLSADAYESLARSVEHWGHELPPVHDRSNHPPRRSSCRRPRRAPHAGPYAGPKLRRSPRIRTHGAD